MTDRKQDSLMARFDRSAWSERLRVSIPSTAPALKRAMGRVRGILSRCGFAQELRTDLEIALHEALANAMEHGNDGRPKRRIFLRCYGGPPGILIAVRDEGPGFDPEAVPDPRADDRLELAHGRGLFLMRQLMDEVVFRRGGREVVLYRAADRTATR